MVNCVKETCQRDERLLVVFLPILTTDCLLDDLLQTLGIPINVTPIWEIEATGQKVTDFP
jgi:hypothetical protein